MKLILVLLFFSLEAQSQDEFYGDWYNIGTERLIHFNFDKELMGWDEKTFLFGDKEGKEEKSKIINIIHYKDLICLVHKDTTNEPDLFSSTVFRYNKDSNFLDMVMGCEGSYKDTLGISGMLNKCDSPGKMIMRLYNKKTIENFYRLRSVDLISKVDLKKVNGLLKKSIDALVKKFGEDRLLWIAPIIFQQALTDILVHFGYNPMLSEKQANDLFSFNFY